MNENPQHLPDFNQLSVLSAAVLLSYALAQLVESQRATLSWDIFGILIKIPFNLTSIAIVLAAGLTATGMIWLLRSHPHFDQTSTFQHWLLPALTAFVLGIPLYNLPHGITWWITFTLGGIILILVFIAEYIVVDPTDSRYPAASATLIALSYILFLILVASLSYVSARLLLVGVTVFPAATLVSLRAIHLRLNRWEISWSIGIGLVCIQMAAALHYWRILPVQDALVVLGTLYALTGFAMNLGENSSLRSALIECAILLALFWGAASLVRL